MEAHSRTRPGATRAASEKVRAFAETRRKDEPLVVTGISPGVLTTISPSMFSRLDIDPAYQRGRTNEIRDIVRVLQAGGMVPDPVTLCRRPWSDDASRLWIVDGHQRVCAFQQLGIPFQAMVHESDSIGSEMRLFNALNSKRALSTNILVKSWTGPSATMLLHAARNESHSLFRRVNLTQGTSTTLIPASNLIKGMAAAMDLRPIGNVQKILGQIDLKLKNHHVGARVLAEHYLRLIGLLYPHGTVHHLIAVALGHVANERWTESTVSMPPAKTIARIQKINWHTAVPQLTRKFEPIVLEVIRKAWR